MRLRFPDQLGWSCFKCPAGAWDRQTILERGEGGKDGGHGEAV